MPLYKNGKVLVPAPATKTSSFEGVVSLVNVDTLYDALSSHPVKEFVDKLCLELREGAKIGYIPFFQITYLLPT